MLHCTDTYKLSELCTLQQPTMYIGYEKTEMIEWELLLQFSSPVLRVAAGMDDPVHVQVEVVKLHLIRVRLSGVHWHLQKVINSITS